MAVKDTTFRGIDNLADPEKKDNSIEGRPSSRGASRRGSKTSLFFLFFGLLFLLSPSPSTGTVNVSPGSDVPLIVQNSPSGTTFNFAAGVYRLSRPIVPKDNDIFIGASGLATTFSGSVVVSSFTHQGSYWVSSLPHVYSNSSALDGSCLSGYTACNLPEDLFFDNKVFQRLPSLSGVVPGKWYWDLSAGKVYMADNPLGHTIDVSVRSRAFEGESTSVTIKGMVIEKFAEQAIYARVLGGQWSQNWLISGNKLRFNHLSAVVLGNGTQILNNTICDNGKLGISGGGDNDLIENNEICRNNYAGYLQNRGGAKFDTAISLVVRGNYVHHNQGVGLHTDSGSLNTLYENNHTTQNQGPGIDHEVSHAATIRNNLVENDAHNPRGSTLTWGAGIWIYASDNVDVYGNTVTNTMNGIGGNQTLRNDTLGTHYIVNLSVHDNFITQEAGTAAGIISNTDSHYYPMVFTQWNNHFDNNTYCMSSASGEYYDWKLGKASESNWKQVYHQDVHSVWTCPATSGTTATGVPSLMGNTVSGSKTGTTLMRQVKFTNTGSGTAHNVTLTQVQTKTQGGSGTVTSLSPTTPISVGNIAVGAIATVALNFNVPSTVTSFTLTETGTMQDETGTNVPFSVTQYATSE
jgi:hypothetical protein